MTVAAAVLTAVALLLARPPGRWLVHWRLGRATPIAARGLLRRWVPIVLVLSAGVAALVLGGSVSHLIAGSTAVGVLVVWMRLRANARAVDLRRTRSQQVAEIVDSLAAELGAGILASQALQHLAGDMKLLDGAASASRLGGDVAGALRAESRQPGAEALEELAAAWEVSGRSGAPMARVLDRLGDGIRDEREAQREVMAGLGPARATARLMAILPLFGLGMGLSMGSRPLDVLFNTFVGSLCLASGAALACAGVWWVDQIAARAERS
ncbi:MAG: type II secretion system F family protein [Aeromicrobium sp.]